MANAVGGKTARACDSCIKQRARWYCAADDAFLCQVCDASVHSANPLARRHERVRLKSTPTKLKVSPPSWFTRKARTPRGKHGSGSSGGTESSNNKEAKVPEVGGDESTTSNEEQVQFRVPIFDDPIFESKSGFFSGLYPSDMDLEEFAADVESLLGKDLENECCFGIDDLGLMDKCYDDDDDNNNNNYNASECSSKKFVKLEDEEDNNEVENQPFELSFDYDSPETCGDDQDESNDNNNKFVKDEGLVIDQNINNNNIKKRSILLNLNYEGVINAWSTSQRSSPWTDGHKPDFDLDDKSWPDSMATYWHQVQFPYGELIPMGIHATAMADGGREARVSRYREKRRTRLFSKKIRYEVRKLNAEKRPRMKGRFVKRASPILTGPSAFPSHKK
ncbi:hypothetical protein ACFE04_016891 [Oxalis oulophora]